MVSQIVQVCCLNCVGVFAGVVDYITLSVDLRVDQGNLITCKTPKPEVTRRPTVGEEEAGGGEGWPW